MCGETSSPLVKILFMPMNILLSVSYITANMYCICLSTCFMYASADPVQICGNIRSTLHILSALYSYYFLYSPGKICPLLETVRIRFVLFQILNGLEMMGYRVVTSSAIITGYSRYTALTFKTANVYLVSQNLQLYCSAVTTGYSRYAALTF